jgi:methylated-DNA-[protein]-cysteine S-methyltransferase
MQLIWDEVRSPVGRLVLVSSGVSLCALCFEDEEGWTRSLVARRFGASEWRFESDANGFSARLRAYFEGDLRALDSIPVDPGGSGFQHGVWLALRSIPPGKTESYGELAVRLGQPKAVRAVGRANALNPVAIVLPCHRVIGASGALTGYGGGLGRKRWLLEHEGAIRRQTGMLPGFDRDPGAE